MSEHPMTIHDSSKRDFKFVSSSGEVLLNISSEGIVFNKDIPADELAKEVISIIEKNCLADHVSKSELRAWCETRVNARSEQYILGWECAMRTVLGKFCKEGEK